MKMTRLIHAIVITVLLFSVALNIPRARGEIPPVASFTENAHTVPVNTPIAFDPSGSSDSDGVIILYEWDWESDGDYDESTTNPDMVSHTYIVPGTYTVTLRVTDNDGLQDTASDSKIICPSTIVERVFNGRFERGELGWSGSAGVTDSMAHTGIYSVKFLSARVFTQLFSPPVRAMELTIWTHPSLNYGAIHVYIKYSDLTQDHYIRSPAGDVWTQSTYEVDPGKQVIELFFMTGEMLSGYAVYLDDVSLLGCAHIASIESIGDTFDTNDDVYVFGDGYSLSVTYDIYVVEDVTEWTDGMTIPSRVSDTATSVSSDSGGDILPLLVWPSVLNPGKYDIVVDVDGDGVYDVFVDALDDNDIQVTAGFFVESYPEYQVIWLLVLIIFIIFIGGYGGYNWWRRRIP